MYFLGGEAFMGYFSILSDCVAAAEQQWVAHDRTVAKIAATFYYRKLFFFLT